MKVYIIVFVLIVVTFLIGYERGKDHVIYKGINEIKQVSETEYYITIDREVHSYIVQ